MIIEPHGLDHILATMQSWIDGEPVWPYVRIIEAWGHEFEHYSRRLHRRMTAAVATGRVEFESPDLKQMLYRGMAIFQLRDEWVSRFGFAIPCAELLDELAKHAPIVEVGAGTGYMTRLLRHRGIDVIGSDPGLGGHGFEVGALDDRQLRAGAKIMAGRHPDRVVFCSWPTYKAMWFRQMLQAMKVGQKLVVIREDACAEESAWEYLDACFDKEATIDIPAFEHMNDYASVHIKRRQRSR